MKTFQSFSAIVVILLIEFICNVYTLPTDYEEVTTQPETKLNEILEINEHNANATTTIATTTTGPPASTTNDMNSNSTADLETAGSEQKEQTVVSPVDALEPSDNVAAASNIDPAVYGGLFSPEAFQQYMNHFGAAYPYASAPYPAPVYPGFIPPPPPIYPSPYVVETGYEGYLVPSTTTSTTTTTAATDTSSTTTTASPTTSMMNPFMVIRNIISAIMMSTLFRVLATIVSAVGMIFFSGAIMNMFCNYTPICEMSYKAVTYLRRRDTAEHMGRMIAEEMTPERIRRAAEFVKSAISKYRELQELMQEKPNDYGTMTSKMRKEI